MHGQVFGLAGTDHARRDLVVPLLWGAPVALAFGLVASLGTAVLTMIISAVGAWYGSWLDELIQRITEVNLVLPFLSILIMVGTLLTQHRVILGATMRSAYLPPNQGYSFHFCAIKESCILSCSCLRASGPRIVFTYMIPRMISIVDPGLVLSVPSLCFLEAGLACWAG